MVMNKTLPYLTPSLHHAVCHRFQFKVWYRVHHESKALWVLHQVKYVVTLGLRTLEVKRSSRWERSESPTRLTTLWSFSLHMKMSLSIFLIFLPLKHWWIWQLFFVNLKTTNESLFFNLFLSKFIVHLSSFNKNLNEWV